MVSRIYLSVLYIFIKISFLPFIFNTQSHLFFCILDHFILLLNHNFQDSTASFRYSVMILLYATIYFIVMDHIILTSIDLFLIVNHILLMLHHFLFFSQQYLSITKPYLFTIYIPSLLCSQPYVFQHCTISSYLLHHLLTILNHIFQHSTIKLDQITISNFLNRNSY